MCEISLGCESFFLDENINRLNPCVFDPISIEFVHEQQSVAVENEKSDETLTDINSVQNEVVGVIKKLPIANATIFVASFQPK